MNFIYMLNLVFVFLLVMTFVIVITKCIGKFKNLGYNKILLILGILFSCIVLTDFMVLYRWIHIMNNPDGRLILDLHPLPEMFEIVLNILIPLVVVSFILVLCKDRNELRKLSSIIGAGLSIFSTIFSVYLAHHMFTEYLARSLRGIIWWF